MAEKDHTEARAYEVEKETIGKTMKNVMTIRLCDLITECGFQHLYLLDLNYALEMHSVYKLFAKSSCKKLFK